MVVPCPPIHFVALWTVICVSQVNTAEDDRRTNDVGSVLDRPDEIPLNHYCERAILELSPMVDLTYLPSRMCCRLSKECRDRGQPDK